MSLSCQSRTNIVQHVLTLTLCRHYSSPPKPRNLSSSAILKRPEVLVEDVSGRNGGDQAHVFARDRGERDARLPNWLLELQASSSRSLPLQLVRLELLKDIPADSDLGASWSLCWSRYTQWKPSKTGSAETTTNPYSCPTQSLFRYIANRAAACYKSRTAERKYYLSNPQRRIWLRGNAEVERRCRRTKAHLPICVARTSAPHPSHRSISPTDIRGDSPSTTSHRLARSRTSDTTRIAHSSHQISLGTPHWRHPEFHLDPSS